MLLMLCSALKMYCFQLFMLFCQRKLQLSRNLMRLELKSCSFQVKKNFEKEKVCVVAEHVHVGTSFWIMKSWILINQKTFECLKEVLKY